MTAANPTKIVDLHTHLFNARCLPMAGIIANLLDKDAGDSWFSRAMARLINGICQSEISEPRVSWVNYSADDYVTHITNAVRAHIGLAQVELPSGLKTMSLVSPVSPVTLAEAQQSEVFQALAELNSSLVELGEIKEPHALALLHVNNLSEYSNQVDSIVKIGLAYVQRAIDKADALVTEIEDFSGFVYCMLVSVHTQASTLLARYSKVQQPLQVVHHMMDMQFAYAVNGTPPETVAPNYDYVKIQLDLLREVANLHSGRIFGFSAFDPRRMDPTGADWKTLVAPIYDKQKGLRGFKFYPAMGYLPIGATDDPRRTFVISENEVARRVSAFFDWCVEEDVPVFTHCTPIGFETRFAEGLNTSPVHWRALLECKEKPKMRNLRLCFGHGGGGHVRRGKGASSIDYFGWTATEAQWDGSNFGYQVAQMCTEFPNVYCELAYITELFEGADEECSQAQTRLQRNLLAAAQMNGEYPFFEKVAYGSDWNMPSMVRHPYDYLQVFLNMFGNEPKLNALAEEFFWKNAYKFLGLPI